MHADMLPLEDQRAGNVRGVEVLVVIIVVVVRGPLVSYWNIWNHPQTLKYGMELKMGGIVVSSV